MARSIALLLIFLIMSACGTEEESPSINFLTILSGDDQLVDQNSSISEPIVVKATGTGGEGVANQNLILEVTDGDGSPGASTMLTDANGEVFIRFNTGESGVNRLKVYPEGNPDRFVRAIVKTRYNYKIPEEIPDGWEPANLHDQVTNPQLLLDGLERIRWEELTKIHAILLVINNKLVLEEYFPGEDSQGEYFNHTRSTPHEVQSASKSFRSMLIGIAIDQGMIDSEEEKLSTFFPEFETLAEGGKEDISLKHVLTMSSGLEWNEWSGNSLTGMYALPYGQWIGYVINQPLAYTPGTFFTYNTGASIMLNDIVIRSRGPEDDFQSYVLNEYAFKVESNQVPGVGNPLGARTIPRDMAKFGSVYLNAGVWKNTQVVSEEWVEKSFQTAFEVNDAEYGYQWWIREWMVDGISYTSYSAEGNGGQFILLFPDFNTVMVFTGGHFGSSRMFDVFNLVIENILPAL